MTGLPNEHTNVTASGFSSLDLRGIWGFVWAKSILEMTGFTKEHPVSPRLGSVHRICTGPGVSIVHGDEEEEGPGGGGRRAAAVSSGVSAVKPLPRGLTGVVVVVVVVSATLTTLCCTRRSRDCFLQQPPTLLVRPSVRDDANDH